MNLLGILAAVFMFGGVSVPQESVPLYYQEYTILIRQALAGGEQVTERLDSDGNLVASSKSEMFLTDGLETKRMSFETTMVRSKKDRVLSYSYGYTSGTSGDGYDVSVKNGKIERILRRSGRTNTVSAPYPANGVLVDYNVYYQYDYLVRRYDEKKGGQQTFANFIPIVGSDLPLMLTRLEDSELRFEKGTIAVKNYKVGLSTIWGGILSMDHAGRIVRLYVQNQQIEVIRTDLLPEKMVGPKAPNF